MSNKNSDTLLYHTNISEEGTAKMAEYRKKFYDLAVAIEELGGSAELTLAFRNIQKAMHQTITHLCLTDSTAVKIRI